MIGLAVGVAAGALQYWLLFKFTARITRGAVDFYAVLFGLIQFVLPMAVLVGVALIRREDLLWTAGGITAVLILGALGRFLLKARQSGKRGE